MNCFFNLFLDNFFYYEYTATIVLLHLYHTPRNAASHSSETRLFFYFAFFNSSLNQSTHGISTGLIPLARPK
jgi:hypothetical protein